MLGYFDPLLPGELLHSGIARAARLNGLRKPAEVVFHILGKKHYQPNFGTRLPANANSLIANIPVVLSFDEETILSHSLYPAFAPFLEETRRSKLRASIFEGTLNRNAARAPNTPLRYCPKCASVDLKQHRTVYWHVIAQHHGITACDKCGCALADSQAMLTVTSYLLHASNWINIAQAPIAATKPEIELAQDLRWLITQNENHPGGRRLAQTLKNILLSHSEYKLGSVIKSKTLFSDIKAYFTEPVLSKIQLPHESQLRLAFSPLSPSANFQAYAVIARVAGISILDLFSRAMKSDQPSIAFSPLSLVSDEKIARAKNKILQFLSRHPDAGRRRIGSKESESLRLVLKHAPEWSAKNLPAKRRRNNRTRCHWTVDWELRDKEMAAEVHRAKDNLIKQEAMLHPVRVTRGRVFSEMRLSRWLRPELLGRLPLTKAALNDILDTNVLYVSRWISWLVTQRHPTQHCTIKTIYYKYLRKSCTVSAAAMEVWNTYLLKIDTSTPAAVSYSSAAA
jgi:hypothetical protein